jgi:DNA-binding response OmpR family regulator
MELLQHECFDDAAHCIVVDGQRRHLPPIHWKVMTLLRERPRRLVPSDFIAREAIMRDPQGGGHIPSIRVYICVLRKLMRGTPFGIVNQWDVGYGLFPIDEVVVKLKSDGRHGKRDAMRRMVSLRADG